MRFVVLISMILLVGCLENSLINEKQQFTAVGPTPTPTPEFNATYWYKTTSFEDAPLQVNCTLGPCIYEWYIYLFEFRFTGVNDVEYRAYFYTGWLHPTLGYIENPSYSGSDVYGYMRKVGTYEKDGDQYTITWTESTCDSPETEVVDITNSGILMSVVPVGNHTLWAGNYSASESVPYDPFDIDHDSPESIPGSWCPEVAPTASPFRNIEHVN